MFKHVSLLFALSLIAGPSFAETTVVDYQDIVRSNRAGENDFEADIP
jgi:hypothetical protein